MTNLQLLVVPNINSSLQESLKQDLITNSQTIITLAKELQNIRIYRDLHETRIDGLDEIVGELYPKYAYMREYLAPIMDIGLSLSKDILKILRSTNPDMKILENQRDEIVEKMY